MVTFETAKRLKKAGFKQPDFGHKQFWYNYHGNCLPFEALYMATCFAPTAIDILEQLPVGTMIERKETGIVCVFQSSLGFVAQAEHENPAEAAAAVWLHINEPFELKK